MALIKTPKFLPSIKNDAILHRSFTDNRHNNENV